MHDVEYSIYTKVIISDVFSVDKLITKTAKLQLQASSCFGAIWSSSFDSRLGSPLHRAIFKPSRCNPLATV